MGVDYIQVRHGRAGTVGGGSVSRCGVLSDGVASIMVWCHFVDTKVKTNISEFKTVCCK